MRNTDTYFQGKNVIVTGGSSGIGKALARLLAREGSDVFIIARDQAKLDQALQEIETERIDAQQRFKDFSADVTDPEEVEAIIDAIVEAGDPPDILVNSAGIAHPGHFRELPLSSFTNQMNVNYFGTLHTVRAVLPYMIDQGSGRIVNVSSVGGFIGGFGYSAYGASKFAVCGFTEALRAELKPRGIGVSIVFPADTDTPQLREERKVQPFELKMVNGAVEPKKLDRLGEILAHRLAKWLLTDDGEPMSPEQVATAIIRGIRRGHYTIFPDKTLKLAYYLRGFMVPLGNWIQDQLITVARREQASD
jgi:3-dehydrosphinganine reductase